MNHCGFVPFGETAACTAEALYVVTVSRSGGLLRCRKHAIDMSCLSYFLSMPVTATPLGTPTEEPCKGCDVAPYRADRLWCQGCPCEQLAIRYST